jgi:hypothetical protein
MTQRLRLLPILAEIALAGAVLASLGWTLYFFNRTAYLPQPFVYDTNDTFMDWFNTGYWAHHWGAFDVWRTIYPPLSFIFLQVTSLPGCYLSSPFYARDCDWLARLVICSFYLVDVALIAVAFWRADKRTAPMRAAALGLGLPLLYTLERGNLIIVAFAFFVIAYGDVTRSKVWRVISVAVTINFKPYLVLPTLAHAIRRDWRMLELVGIASIALYLVTLALVGSGTPMEIVSNTANWVLFQGQQVWSEVNFATSYEPLLRVTKLQLPVLEYVSSRTVDAINLAGTLVIRTTQAIALVALVGLWLQPRAISSNRMSAIVLGAYFVTTSPGGYTLSFLLFFVLLEPWRRPGPIVAVTCAYLLCIVGDWQLSTIMQLSVNSWLGGRGVNPVFGLTIGQFVRPALVAVIVWALSFDTIFEVVRAHRHHRPVLGLAAA